MPANTPESTGKKLTPTVMGERYAHSNRMVTAMKPPIARRPASLRMVLLASTAKTGAPETNSCTVSNSGCSACTWRKACCNATKVCSCAAVSEPAAAVCAINKARWPLDDTHTSPSAGCSLCAIWLNSSSTSPVGSCGKICLSNMPAGDASACTDWPMACRSPSTLKCFASTAGLSA